MTCRMHTYLGAYVLGALEPEEAQRVSVHLAGCDACSQELATLADTVALLDLLTLRDVEELSVHDRAVAPPRHPGRCRTRRHKTRRQVGLTVTAALIVATTLGAARALDGAHTSPPPGALRVMDPVTHAQAAVTMTSKNWGTQLHLDLTGGYPRGWCSLVAHSRDGQTATAASWQADVHGRASVVGTTTIPADRLTELDVVTLGGIRLVQIDLTGHDK